MTAETPSESRVNLSNTKQNLSKWVNQVARGETRVVIEKSNLPVAAIISARDYERFQLMEADRARRVEAITRMSESLADVPVETIEAEVNRIVAEFRAPYRTGSSNPQ